MPTLRGSEQGSKKRYAGLVVGPRRRAEGGHQGPRSRAHRLDAAGAALPARAAPPRVPGRALRVLDPRAAPTSSSQAGSTTSWSTESACAATSTSYVKNVPPHVAAARQLDRRVREIAYVITTRGPQPLEKQRHRSTTTTTSRASSRRRPTPSSTWSATTSCATAEGSSASSDRTGTGRHVARPRHRRPQARRVHVSPPAGR